MGPRTSKSDEYVQSRISFDGRIIKPRKSSSAGPKHSAGPNHLADLKHLADPNHLAGPKHLAGLKHSSGSDNNASEDDVDMNDTAFVDARTQGIIQCQGRVEDIDTQIYKLQEERAMWVTRKEQLEAEERATKPAKVTIYNLISDSEEDGEAEEATKPAKVNDNLSKLEPTVSNLISDSEEEDIQPAGRRWKGKANATVQSEPSSPGIKPIPQPKKGKRKAVPASRSASGPSTLSIIIATGDFYWQLATPQGTVGKRQGDHCMNATEIVHLKGYQENDRIREMAAVKRELKCGIWEKRAGSGSKITGMWIAFEDAVALIEKLGLSEHLKALVDIDGFPMPVLTSPPATLTSDSVHRFSYTRNDATLVNNFLKVETSRGPITRKLDNNWLNVTQIIHAAGASKLDWTSLRPRYEKGIHESINWGHTVLRGLYVPHKKAIQIADMWSVGSLIAPLVSDLEEPAEGEDEDDLQEQSIVIRDLKPGDLQYKTIDRKTYVFTNTGTCILTKRIEDDWLNATQILSLTTLKRHQIKQELQVIRRGDHGILRGGFLSGTYIPWHRGVRLAKDKEVFDQLRILVGDADSDDEEEDEGAGESSYLQQWRDINFPNSLTNVCVKYRPGKVGQIIVISRNSGILPDNARDRLISDGLRSVDAFKACFGVACAREPVAIGFNGIRSIFPAVYDDANLPPNNVYDQDRRRIINAIRSTPEGERCVILVRGLDGWTSDVKSLRGFAEAFKSVDLWLVSLVPGDWGYSKAWELAENGIRYNAMSMSELMHTLPSSRISARWQVDHFVRVLDKINSEKNLGRGAHIGWLTRGRAWV